eukprot:3712381-Amphidinium_carterae.1
MECIQRRAETMLEALFQHIHENIVPGPATPELLFKPTCAQNKIRGPYLQKEGKSSSVHSTSLTWSGIAC